jgi:hypothetical protein
MTFVRSIIIGIAAMLAQVPVFAAGPELSGSVGAELRWFPEDPQFSGQLDHFQPSLNIEPEFRWVLGNGDQITFSPYALLDGQDSERTHFDVREAYWRHFGENWDLLIGVDIVYWGVTESRHLVDIINQIDGVVDIDEEDRLGQPMITLSTQRDWGRLALFVLPGFRERTFTGEDGRLRFALPIDDDESVYESGAEEKHIDFAARYTHYIGDWDIGAHLFYGTGREPLITLDANNQKFIPNYDLITQFGVDLQYTKDAWLWKFEGIVRNGQGKTFAALVGGFEHTFYQIRRSAADLGLLIEYLYDGRNDDPSVAPPALLQNDLFFGLRLALNDIQDTSVLMGAIVDLDDQSTLFQVEAQRRLGEHWTVEIQGRFFLNVGNDALLLSFRKDNFVNLGLARHF